MRAKFSGTWERHAHHQNEDPTEPRILSAISFLIRDSELIEKIFSKLQKCILDINAN